MERGQMRFFSLIRKPAAWTLPLLAVPAGILSAGFVEVLEKDDKSKTGESGSEADADSPKKYCPHCGKKLD